TALTRPAAPPGSRTALGQVHAYRTTNASRSASTAAPSHRNVQVSPTAFPMLTSRYTEAITTLAQRAARADSAKVRITIRLGTVMSASPPSAHVWVMSNCHTRPNRMSSMVPGLYRLKMSTYTYRNITTTQMAASFNLTGT